MKIDNFLILFYEREVLSDNFPLDLLTENWNVSRIYLNNSFEIVRKDLILDQVYLSLLLTWIWNMDI